MPQSEPTRLSSLADALREDACPLCSLLKEFQTCRLRETDTRLLENVCSFHIWMVAKTGEAGDAAVLYCRLIDRSLRHSSVDDTCDICARIHREEVARVQEFAEHLAQPEFLQWLRQQGTLCLPHARTLLSHLPEQLQKEVLAAVNKRGAELKKRLAQVLRDAEGKGPVHGGVLGRVAEYLVAQRGLGVRF